MPKVNYLLRRRRLGKTSCEGIRDNSNDLIQVFRNDNRTLDRIDPGIVFRWGCTSNIPGNPTRVLNQARAIHQVNDKVAFRELLNPEGLCPETWFSFGDVPNKNITLVVRPRVHAQGRQLFVTRSERELMEVAHRLGHGNYYISPLIPKTNEYRVFVAQGRAVWVAEKTPGNPEDVAWNVARGGRFDNVRWMDWPLKVVSTAIRAFNLTDLDYGGVDVMWDERERKAYVLEINSAPSQTSPYRQSCVGRTFSWMIENNNFNRIGLVNERGGYLKFIHPSLDEKAMLV